MKQTTQLNLQLYVFRQLYVHSKSRARREEETNTHITCGAYLRRRTLFFTVSLRLLFYIRLFLFVLPFTNEFSLSVFCPSFSTRPPLIHLIISQIKTLENVSPLILFLPMHSLTVHSITRHIFTL